MLKSLTLALASLLLVANLALSDDKPKTEPVSIGPATYAIPSNWERQRPSSQMRMAQFGVPLADGDEGKPELVVSHFPGNAGGVDANIERWKKQFSDVKGEPKVEKFEVDGLKMTVLDITGAYKDPFSPIGGPNYRMLGGIVETGDGPFFFKLTGPNKSITAQADGYWNMLKTAKKN